MGKTKTAFIGGAPEEAKSGKEAYEEKRKRKAAAQAQEEKKSKKQVTGVGLKGGERIKVVGAELPPVEAEKEVESEEKKGKAKKTRVRSEKYLKLKAKIDRNKLYSLTDAIKLVRQTSFSKFDGTLEMHILVKKKGLTESVTLPHLKGKEKKIEVADDKTIEKLKKNMIDFDVLLATSDMMPKLVPFAKFLGPKGLMPNPKQGTIIKDTSEKSIAKFSQSSVLKTEKDAPIIHTVTGKLSQTDKELEENANAVLDAVNRKQVLKAYLKATMSPSVKLEY